MIMSNFMEELFNAVPTLEELVKNGTFDDNGYHYKDGNTEIHLVIKADKEEEKDLTDIKQEFENWLETIDDEIFEEVCEKAGKEFVTEFNEVLKTGDEKLVDYIDEFCEMYEDLIEKKITDLHFAYVSECDDVQKEADSKKNELRVKYEKEINKLEEMLED